MAKPLIGLAGYKGSGKDTFAQFLVDDHGWTRFAFADRLKGVAYDSNVFVRAIVDRHGWDAAKGTPFVRGFLQRLGVAMREHVDPNVWVRPLVEDLAAHGGPAVVTDVRFDNEVEAIRALGGQVRLVVRDGCEPDGHASEELASRDRSFFDAVIYNNVDLDRLRQRARAAAIVLGAAGPQFKPGDVVLTPQGRVGVVTDSQPYSGHVRVVTQFGYAVDLPPKTLTKLGVSE